MVEGHLDDAGGGVRILAGEREHAWPQEDCGGIFR